MEFKELEKKSVMELHTLLQETREALRMSRFSVAQKQLKNVALICIQKKLIARVLSRLQMLAHKK